jgi:hypothetical protein
MGRREDKFPPTPPCAVVQLLCRNFHKGVIVRPLGRPRRRWVDNIKMDLREIGWDGMDWINLAQDRDQWRALVNTVMNFRVA